jgi:hypothetical protein
MPAEDVVNVLMAVLPQGFRKNPKDLQNVALIVNKCF